MLPMEEPADTHFPPINIRSFLIRFVISEPGPPPAYRGVVRYIPTGEEISFTRWADVVQFVQRFLSIQLEER